MHLAHAELEEPLDRFGQALEARFGEPLIILAVFGSRTQDRERPESELDVLPAFLASV